MPRDRRVAALRAPSAAVVAAAAPAALPASVPAPAPATATATAAAAAGAADDAAAAGGRGAPDAWRRLRLLRGRDVGAMAAVAAGVAGVGKPRVAGAA